MRRNNLDLRLVPPPPPSLYSGDNNHHQHQDNHGRGHPIESTKSMDGESESKEKLGQQLTIFYDGRVCVCDVTQVQAKAIIMLASQEMEEKWRGRTPGSAVSSEPSSPLMPSQLCSPSSGLHMKRSLQRFLQKRKHRIQATSPYPQ